jgi:hypothetical protein
MLFALRVIAQARLAAERMVLGLHRLIGKSF